ncbi:MAG: 30S ribosomal protein S20 [Planctomycetes bacterium]|nr:30S ribosomal protein S20 [Planctomycetota bacterium]
MPNTNQARKRLRQDAKRNLRNRMAKSEIKTLTKSALQAMEDGDKEKATELTRTVQVKLDRASKKSTLHANTAGRRKSQLQRRLATFLRTQ